MNSTQKNNLVLAALIGTLDKFDESPEDYIQNYDITIGKQISSNTGTWDNKDNLIRDLKLLANEYYRRINKKSSKA